MIRPDIILLDVGGTFVKSALGIAGKGALKGTFTSTPISSDGCAEQIETSFRQAVAGMMDLAAREGFRIKAVCSVMPGPFDYKEGIFLMKHKFASVYGRSFRDILGYVVNDDIRLAFAHDVNAALSGALTRCPELRNGTVALSTLGTGLGFAHAEDGHVMESPTGSPAINIWNMPYEGGILEDYVSRRAILRFFAGHGGVLKEGEDVKEIAEMARKGDERAAEAFRCAGRHYVAGARAVMEGLGVRRLLFAGQIAKSFDLMEGVIRDGFEGSVELSVLDDIQGTALAGAASL